jgi:SAM-dependent methyltransferase
MKQKDVFLQGEGDAWLQRNRTALERRTHDPADPILGALTGLLALPGTPPAPRVLEVGCGDAGRLAWLKAEHGVQALGLDPSAQAVEVARGRGVDAVQGTADRLPFDSASIDILIYGFCLCMCDRDDLFQIAAEGHRVLKPQSWLVIGDFYAREPKANPYHHREGLTTWKMDCRRLFDWHPHYTCTEHRVYAHGGAGFTDDPHDWVALSVLRRHDGR